MKNMDEYGTDQNILENSITVRVVSWNDRFRFHECIDQYGNNYNVDFGAFNQKKIKNVFDLIGQEIEINDMFPFSCIANSFEIRGE